MFLVSTNIFNNPTPEKSYNIDNRKKKWLLLFVYVYLHVLS